MELFINETDMNSPIDNPQNADGEVIGLENADGMDNRALDAAIAGGDTLDAPSADLLAQDITDVPGDGYVEDENLQTCDGADGGNAQTVHLQDNPFGAASPLDDNGATVAEHPQEASLGAMSSKGMPFHHTPSTHSPLEHIYMPMPDPGQCEFDFNFTPNNDWHPLDLRDIPLDKMEEACAAWREPPIGWNDKGIPVFRAMPNVDAIEGEFIVAVDRRFSGKGIEWVHVPEAGSDRDGVLNRISSVMEEQARIECAILEATRHERMMEQRKSQLEWERKDQEVRHEMAEMERADIWNMTRDQYRTVSGMGLTRLDPSQPYSDVFKDSTGDIYRVRTDGSKTKLYF